MLLPQRGLGCERIAASLPRVSPLYSPLSEFGECTSVVAMQTPQALTEQRPTLPFITSHPRELGEVLFSVKITSKRVVRSSAGACAIYPPFLGAICVRYPKVWYRISNTL